MLTKFLAQALMPLNFALEAVLLAVVLSRLGWRRTARALAAAGFVVVWAASTPVVASSLVRGLESRHAPMAVDATPVADAIVVLGGAIGPARPPRLSPDLTEAADRVLLAARLFRAGKAPLVVASGGAGSLGGRDVPESRDMADLLVEWGVPRGAVVEEGASGDTAENASETKRLLDARGLKRVLLVTSALHMSRALAAFRAAGIDAVPCPTDFLGVEPAERTVLDWIPDAEALGRSTAVVHEWLGRIWYTLRGRA